MKNILKYSFIIFSFALTSSFLISTFAIDLKIKNFNETLIGLSLSFFGLGVVVASFTHNIIREKFNLYFTLISSVIIQFLFILLIFIHFKILTIILITFVLGFTNHINFLTIETHISSKYKINSGFYISLFWSSAGLGAILGSLIIAINGVNIISYFIALSLTFFQFVPILIAKSNVMNIIIENVKFSLSYKTINNIKFILLCVFLLGINDASWNSLFPSYLIEKGFTDKDVGQINFISGTLVLIIYPFVGKLIDKTNKIIMLNFFCFLSISGLCIFYFTESYFSTIFFTAIFYLSIGSIFLIYFNIINTNLKNNLIVFGVASYSISENIGSFLGPNIVGGLITYEINYFLLIFIFVFILIFLIFNFLQKK
jgi:predicted MFS family arabinose efflux permease